VDEVRWLGEDEQGAWRAWLAVGAQLSSRLHRELQAQSGLSLADYDVLVALTDSPTGSLRMYEVCDRLQWEKSRLSKQVARMAARGLVVRRGSAEDRRGAVVELTDEGLASIRSAAPAHAELVRRLVFDGLTPAQVRSFREVCEAVLGRLADDDNASASA
jgi:DNA-binding MarR family transcriptional regulator